jgi:integrase
MAGQAGRRVGRLSARRVATIRKPGLHGDGGNLFLKVDDGGSKSWMFRHQVNGRVSKYGLGPIHTVSLVEARERAQAIRKQILDGVDPRAARREAAVAAAKSIAFDDAANRYIASHKAGWKNAKHVAQWGTTLRSYASPVFGKLPVSAIDTGLVMRVLEPLWTSKNATAHRLRGRIESVLDWAKAHGYREGENPAVWKGNLDHLLPAAVGKTVHHAAMPFDQIAAFVDELRGRDDLPARALELLILTAARTGEVLGAQWSEFDLANRLWTVPAERMKAGREHRVPLSDRAVAIVQEMQRSGDLVFPGAKRGRPLGPSTFQALLRHMGRDVTAHGFRSSFRDWISERTSYPTEVAEMALAHAVGNKVEASYRRGDLLDKRRELMGAWAAFCDSRAVSNVVALRS